MKRILPLALLAFVLAAPSARAAAVTPPDQPVLVDTSASAGSVVASSSSSATYSASHAFDGNWSDNAGRWLAYTNPDNDYGSGVHGESPMYLVYKFNNPTKVNVLRLRIQNANEWDKRSPKAWTFLGSNDGTIWTQLDSRSGVTWASGDVTKSFSFENRKSYEYYKFCCTEIVGENNYMQIYELQFLYNPGIVLTDLTSPSGIISTTTAGDWVKPAKNAFDNGTSHNNDDRSIHSGTTVDWIYTFDTPTAVNAYKVYAPGSSVYNYNLRIPKTWTFEAKNAADATWTILDTQTSETGWAALESRYYEFVNTTAYDSYRFAVTANQAGSDDYIQIDELEFFFVNRGGPALSDATLTRTGVGAYDVSATEAANAADLFWIADDGAAATTNLLAADVAEGASVTNSLSGLAADTTYRVSVLATNESGTAEAVAGTLYTGALSLGATTNANETGLVAGGVVVSRGSAAPFPLMVNYTISGSAGSEGATWAAPEPVTIPAGAASATLPVVPLSDDAVNADVAITVALAAGNYEPPASNAAALTLANHRAAAPLDFAKKIVVAPSETALAKIGDAAWADFPVLVRLPAEASGEFLAADGSDLLVQDENGTTLPFEIETFDPAGTTFVWVKLPSLSASTELTLYFGGAANADNAPTDVWSRYVGVWHFDADAAGTATVADATGHALDGTTTGDLTAVDGPFGDRCLRSSASTSAPDFEPGFSVGATFTASGWFKAPEMTTSEYVSPAKKKGSTWNAGNGWYLEMPKDTGKLQIILTANTPSTTVSDVRSNWHYFEVVSGGGSVKVYLDGGTSPKINSTYTIVANSERYSIQAPKMLCDEYRLRKGAASAAETALEYATMADAAFFEYGAVAAMDATAPTVGTPAVTRDAGGAFTVTAEISENVPTAVFCDADGVTNAMATADAALPMTYSATLAGLAADTTYACAVGAGSTGGTVSTRTCPTAFYNGDLTVAKISDAVENGLVPGVFRISRADTAHDLAVAYTVGGTATAGQTYTTLSGTATIPAGATSVDIQVVPLLDSTTTSNTTVSVTLSAGLYGIDAQAGAATMTIENLVAPAGFNVWVAPSAGLASVGSNWSEGHCPTASENVLFDGRFSTADCEWDAAASATVASWTQTNGYTGAVTVDTVFPEKGAFTCLTVSGDMVVASGSVTHKSHNATDKVDTYRLRLDVGGDLTVASGAKITARGKGSYGDRNEGSATYGGSYNGNSSWGSLTEPTGVGSSAYADGTYAAYAGGAIWIEVVGDTVLNGVIGATGIQAAGQWGNSYAGSGGAVYLKTGTLSGTGAISADCENTGVSSKHWTAAGGRVSVLLTSGELDSFPNANLTAVAGKASYANVGGVGTVLVRSPLHTNGVLYLRDRSDKYGMYAYRPKPNQLTRIPAGQTWVLDGIVFGPNAILQVPAGTTLELPGGLASVSSTATALDDTGLLVDGGTLLLPNAATHTVSGKWIFEPTDFALTGDLVVTNGAGVGTLLLYSTTSNDVRTCGLAVSGDMRVASGSYLRAVRGGYIATGAATVGGDIKGAHGGTRAATTTANRSYDSFFHPRHPGAFGNDNGRVNVGGGAIRLAVGGTLTLDGVAIATPNVAEDRCGAAGSIDITAARLEGAGRIEANGNSRNYQAADSSSAGGGGRIAVRLTGADATFSDAWLSKINAKGFYSSKITAAYSSSAGSVYLQDGTRAEGAGTIVIRNTGDTANNVAVTELPSLKAGGEDDDFRKASLSLEAAARVQLHADLRMEALDMAAGTVLDLNGLHITVRTAHAGGVNVRPGTYTAGSAYAIGAGTLGDYLVDTAGGGTLRVLGSATVLIVR